MNKKLMGAFVLASVIAAPAFADGGHDYPPANVQPHAAATVHGSARAHLRLHLRGADTSRLPDFSQTYYPAQPAQVVESAGLTRAEVRADLAKARAAHEIPSYTHG
ncbi:DUF4148 domain-containing protein [Paraburkholderia caballeronis]|uniref:DUF4148 domain-containing protein n=1 Tax=Paraburkholderia caballeronis TaxID=416943 RepID=A0A1H7P518_9BURK|nr:DUF4148 domain-containing protein [Paraburkholderia caballeronis]PXW25374.1 uncharacterized protein DUF4148 [Paraburkholderia caballeronis]PXX00981.1 uncharacterized protein DUF4148 [Paraburkholderia caballeronis]RAJ99666.1 uncharacterized protein DUF4148 [Paraburkholderia caballeronis]SEE39992.1 protein of unknown function [Paraburkholderia caballeronis]SEL30990.1 protein of unknown function [Paraburkholderia caballeronis]